MNETRQELDFTSLLEENRHMEQVRGLLEADGRPHHLAYVHSYGCQANVADGEKLKGLLAQMGYGFTQRPDDADLILLNTCAVREGAEDRVYGNVGALKHQKRRNPGLIIGLCGCMMQQPPVADRIKRSFPHVDLVFGTNAIHRLPGMLHERLAGGARVFELSHNDATVVENIPARRDGALKAWLPIMYGCDNFCSYCIVPYVRGRERSRKPESILEEARALVKEGYRELTLLGQNVNSYGKGLEEDLDFAALLRAVNGIPGKFRIRFMTSHPKDCSRGLIDAMAECEKVCNFLHLPVQSGSDRVLEAMNRRYTAGAYLELIEYARERIPGLTFSSDIIVGFPGELEADFEQTMGLIRRVGYVNLFTFLYSRRTGTKAAGLPDAVPAAEKSRWLRRLLAEQEGMARGIHQAMVGQTYEVLVENSNGEAPQGKHRLAGRTATNVLTEFEGPPELVGQFVPVHITQAFNRRVFGVLQG